MLLSYVLNEYSVTFYYALRVVKSRKSQNYASQFNVISTVTLIIGIIIFYGNLSNEILSYNKQIPCFTLNEQYISSLKIKRKDSNYQNFD